MQPTDTADPDYYHKVVDCQWACPTHTDVPEYIRLIAQGRYADAYLVNRESNVFPGILGRVCDRPCEPACRRGRVEEKPVAICRLKRIAADGFTWTFTAVILAGVALGVVFVRRQQRLADPLIDLRLFSVPAFSASLGTYLMAIFVMFGVWLLIAQYLQLVLGLSPMKAGLWGVPSSIAFIIGSMTSPMLVRRFRPAIVMGGGMVVAVIGALVLTQVTPTSGIAIIVIGLTIMGLAISPVVTLATDLVVGSAPPERAGAASAISETGAEFGGALSIAMLGSIGTAVYRRTMATTVADGVAPDALEAARSTLGGAVSAVERLPSPAGAELLAAARDAFTQALSFTATISAVLALATAAIAVIALRGVPARGQSESVPAA